MKKSHLDALENLYSFYSNADICVPAALVSEMSAIARKINRMVGVILDRRGSSRYVAVGRADRLYLPDLGRSRASDYRLRGLRLIAVKPVRNLESSHEIDADFLIDLEKLRLDFVAEVIAGQAGEQRIFFGTLSNIKHGLAPNVKVYSSLKQIETPFSSLISAIEQGQKQRVTTNKSTQKNSAVLIGVYANGEKNWQENIQELVELAESCKVNVVDIVSQRKKSIDPKTLVGKGKLEEICLQALSKGAEMLIFDGEVSPSQLNAITQLTNLKVIDRTMLILDIFAQRAKSKAGRLQVELAQLKYSLPRLSLKQSGMSRLSGGIGGQGPGETKLEIDKRRARDRIKRLEDAVAQLQVERALRRKNRSEKDIPILSIVGYTNAGKSTLLNQLTKSDVYVQDELFATLDPSSRRLRFPNEQEVIITDTVGFIRELPEGLVHAFRATLEELKEADLILHVVDSSNPNYARHIKVVNSLINEILEQAPPQILLLNKADKVDAAVIEEMSKESQGLPISAIGGDGLLAMLKRCGELLWS